MTPTDNMIIGNGLPITSEQAQNEIETYDNLYEKKNFGTLDYPVSAYFLDLHKSYMSWIRWHWHEEMEILLIQDGTAEIFTDDASYVIRPGQGIIINQNVMHCIHSLDQNNCTFYTIVFQPEYLFGQKTSYLHTQYLLPVQNYQLFKIFLLDEKDPWHKRMLSSLNNAISVDMTQTYGYELAAKGYLCLFWADLISHLPQHQKHVSSHVSLDEQRVKQAMLYIRTHYAEQISLEDIADSIHVSKSECCRCFTRTLQMTPFEYLMKYRIFEATKKLMMPSTEPLSIADLALSVGFNNTSYFNKLFKKFLGCTPTYYRTHKVLSKDGDFVDCFDKLL